MHAWADGQLQTISMFECECMVVCRSLLAWFELQHAHDIECRFSVERKWTSFSAISAKTVEMFKEEENVLEKRKNRKEVVLNVGDKIGVRATRKDFNQQLRTARRAAEQKRLGSVCSMTNRWQKEDSKSTTAILQLLSCNHSISNSDKGLWRGWT